jgi:hypothetical protein
MTATAAMTSFAAFLGAMAFSRRSAGTGIRIRRKSVDALAMRVRPASAIPVDAASVDRHRIV